MSEEAVEGVSRLNVLLYSISRPTYKPRRPRSKGAILSLFWNFCILVVGILYIRSSDSVSIHLPYKILFGCVVFAFPVAGFLADTYIGRYKVMKYSMVFAWLAAIVHVAVLILQIKMKINYLVLPSLGICLLSFAVCQANAIQFGFDQLVDASSNDISSYVSWYAWAYFMSEVVGVFSQYGRCQIYTLATMFIAPFLLTLCLCSDIYFGNAWLNKEPVTCNPLSLVFRVLLYAKKNKYPCQRSAFTYWDEKSYSRIDLAKNRFGGPFTTEQVEDVKTFFRILIVISLGSLFVGLVYVGGSKVADNMIPHYEDLGYVENCLLRGYTAFFHDFFERSFVRCTDALFMVLVIPIFEFLIYPLFWKCIPRLGIMNKFILGMFLLLVYMLSLMALEFIGHHVTSLKYAHKNYTVACMLTSSLEINRESLSLDFKWIALTRFFDGAGLYFLLTSTVEFVSAQSPYSMKGLIGGLIYSITSIAVFLSTLIKTTILYVFKKYEVGSLKLKFGCGIWYFMAMSTITLVLIVFAIVITKCYSRRRREEDLPSDSEQLFAVDDHIS